jgi:hypothetical protein
VGWVGAPVGHLAHGTNKPGLQPDSFSSKALRKDR